MAKSENFKIELHTSECIVLAGHSFTSNKKFDRNGNPMVYNMIEYYSGYNRKEGNINLVAFTAFCSDELYKLFSQHGAGFYNLIFDGSGHLINADFISNIIRDK